MDLGQKGVFWFTDALTPTQLVELAHAPKNSVTPHCGTPRC